MVRGIKIKPEKQREQKNEQRNKYKDTQVNITSWMVEVSCIIFHFHNSDSINLLVE